MPDHGQRTPRPKHEDTFLGMLAAAMARAMGRTLVVVGALALTGVGVAGYVAVAHSMPFLAALALVGLGAIGLALAVFLIHFFQ